MDVEILQEYWPFLLPLIIAEFGLMITALVHVLRHPTYKFGSRALWILIVVLLQIIGPIVYFIFGRSEDA
ncbi:MAG TPA: PLD nuclease N-terminal domain-containing protein [Limnochordia bacterium]|nr:PLD nuclease N-terminal domain-containing protein [Limnochordia bacterium]